MLLEFDILTFTFTFMHLADAFIQSDLHCIQVTVFYILSALAFPGNRTHDLGGASAMLYHLSYRNILVLVFSSDCHQTSDLNTFMARNLIQEVFYNFHIQCLILIKL